MDAKFDLWEVEVIARVSAMIKFCVLTRFGEVADNNGREHGLGTWFLIGAVERAAGLNSVSLPNPGGFYLGLTLEA